MACMFIAFELMATKLFMLKSCGIIDISKKELSFFPVLNKIKIKRAIKKKQKKLNNHSKHLKFQVLSIKSAYSFGIFTETLIFFVLVPYCRGDNVNLPRKNNISKTVIVNIGFTITFFKEYWISFILVCKLMDSAFGFLKLLSFWN